METRRRLPHISPPDRWIFVTWHLHGSLPASYPPPHAPSAGHAFVWIDRYLDSGRTGPLFLKDPRIAGIVMESLCYGERIGHYELRAFVVMANHVHALLLPRVPLSRLMRSLKGSTARDANRVLRRTGEPFWQAESYDHFVRDERELEKIVRYIESNPVKAGLVQRPEDYLWSSACAHTSVGTAGTSACATA